MKIQLEKQVGNHKKGAILDIVPYVGLKLIELKTAKAVKSEK